MVKPLVIVDSHNKYEIGLRVETTRYNGKVARLNVYDGVGYLNENEVELLIKKLQEILNETEKVKRLDQLKTKRAELDAEIRKIEGSVTT